MSVVMAYSMYAVRLSNEIPIQSECISLMGFFRLFSSVFNLIAMMWFIVLNYLKSKEYLPKVINLCGDCLQKIVCLCFHKESRQKLAVSSQVSNSNEPEQKKNLEDQGKCRYCSNKKYAENDKTEMKKILYSNCDILNFAIFCFY